MFKRFTLGIIVGLLFVFPVSYAAQYCYVMDNEPNTPYTQFSLTGDGTVRDKKNSLMWKACVEGQTWKSSGQLGSCSGDADIYTWQEALNKVQEINESGGWAGYSDWRMPNLKELHSIVEEHCFYPAIHYGLFPGFPTDTKYWTSSPAKFKQGYAWIINFDDGKDAYRSFYDSYSLRLVRDWDQ